MVAVDLNKPGFEYDIHSLIKAFFPEEYVGVSAEKKTYEESVTLWMRVEYGEDFIGVLWKSQKQENDSTESGKIKFKVNFSDRAGTKNA